jgi:hypothetical protein
MRYVHGGRVSRVKPMTVVEDVPGHVALFIAAGSPMKTRCGLDGVPIARGLPYAERFALPWRLCDGVWEGNSVLMLTPAGAGHSFWAVWDTEWRFEVWYVNVQEPLRRTRFGFDTADNVLDVVIEPDLSSWRWKDEDELEEAVRVGRFTPEQAAAVREEGRRAVATLEARAWPFDRDWRDWRPETTWPQPALPDDPSAYADVSRGQSPGHVLKGP